MKNLQIRVVGQATRSPDSIEVARSAGIGELSILACSSVAAILAAQPQMHPGPQFSFAASRCRYAERLTATKGRANGI
jgi:hypothetical protein